MTRDLHHVALALALVACSAPSLQPDASAPPDDAARDAAEMDAWRRQRPDTGPLPPAAYDPCIADTDCLPGLTCASRYPRGLCSTTCTMDAECPDAGLCIAGLCVPRCEVGSGRCRGDSMCVGVPGTIVTDHAGFCASSCDRSGAIPEAACARGTCGVHGGCDPEPPATRAVGEPCTSREECGGVACPPIMNVCTSLTRQPADTGYLAEGTPMPQGGCASGEVAMPIGGDLALAFGFTFPGDAAFCVPSCQDSSECLPGFLCDRRGLADGALHTTGGCMPDVCLGMEGDPCGQTSPPTGHCHIDIDIFGLCGP